MRYPVAMALSLSVAMASAGAADGGSNAVVVTGKLLSVNGTTQVPADMFGVHAMPMNPDLTKDWNIELYRQIYGGLTSKPTMPDAKNGFGGLPAIMDCQGDRYRAPLVLTDHNYEKTLAATARQYAEAARKIDTPRHIVEFWNEPFLNWASRSDICYDTQYYDVTQAGQDKPVIIKTTGKPARYLKWRWALIGKDAKGVAHSRVSAPKGVKEGDAFTLSERAVWKPFDRSGTYTAVWGWQVYDPTQVSYWSARQNADYYNMMLLPYAKAHKEAAPDLPLIAGWSFNFRSNNYASWDMLYKPTIDAAIAYIDGVNEHHYGTSPHSLAADYEMVVGYAAANHGKWIKVYNTEANVNPDPAVLNALPPEEKAFRRAQLSYAYTLRDILFLIARVPDKAGSRTAHSPTESAWGAGGDEYAFKLLKDFRGNLVETRTPDKDLSVSACINPATHALVVVVLNESSEARKVPVRISAPTNTSLTGATLWGVSADPEAKRFSLTQTPLPAAAISGGALATELTVPARDAIKLTLTLQGDPAAKPEVERRQFFAKEILAPVTPGQPLTVKITADPAVLARTSAARVRLVVDRLPPPQKNVPAGDVTSHPARTVTPVSQRAPQTAPGTQAAPATRAATKEPPQPEYRRFVTIDGTRMEIPRSDTILELPVDPKTLKADNTLSFETDSGDPMGFRLNVASIMLDAAVK